MQAPKLSLGQMISIGSSSMSPPRKCLKDKKLTTGHEDFEAYYDLLEDEKEDE